MRGAIAIATAIENLVSAPNETVAAPRREDAPSTAPQHSATFSSTMLPSDQAERSEPRRGRRGRRRGRRGGAARGMGSADANTSGTNAARDEAAPPPALPANNGGQSQEALPEARDNAPREPAAPRETLAHFEPSVPPASPSATQSARPFVVWSSAPGEKPAADDRGQDE